MAGDAPATDRRRGRDRVVLSNTFMSGSHVNTSWRREHGALWDVCPHIIAALVGALGPIARVMTAARGAGHLIHFVLLHESGATSTVSATLHDGPTSRMRMTVWTSRA